MTFINIKNNILIYLTVTLITQCRANDILGCGGFVKSHVSLDFSKIEISLYTREGSLKEKTECAPTNGYYFLPLYEKGDYVLKVHPPAGWSFEPSQVDILVDGDTDKCSTSQDINFSFNGFGITGKVITAGQALGPSGVNVELVNDKGDVRNAVTKTGGNFHFTPVIPGEYVVKASHSRWKLEPSQTVVQVKESNTVLPVGALVVKGYDVKGAISSFGDPISGIYVLLYSQKENPKFRVEGCKTALLQGVPDAPICYAVTDASGEFAFGLVPAGDYKLLALAKPPGQATASYNIKPDVVQFNVQHDSLYIRSAFEVTGFNIVGSVLTSPGGSGVSGVQVLVAGEPVATTDKAGQFPLKGLKPGTYNLSFKHEQCEVDHLQLQVSSSGAGAASAVVARWRVCGELSPPARRTVSVHVAPQRPPSATLHTADDGTWCTFLSPGLYSVKVDVSEQEQRDGLQFYPEWRQVSVGRGPEGGVSFSMVRVTVRGRVRCDAHCEDVRVTLRPLAADGTYSGPPRTAALTDEQYSFSEVAPGSVEVAVVSARVCWREPRLNVAAQHDMPPLPDFEPRGLLLRLRLSHDTEVDYESDLGRGTLTLPSGDSTRCLPAAASYKLTPRGCHLMRPSSVIVDMTQRGGDAPLASFVAEAHAAVVTVTSPLAVSRLQLLVTVDGHADTVTLTPVHRGDEFVYEHTLYLAEGSVAEVSAQSPELVFPAGAGRVRGAGACQPAALTLRAARALYVRGRVTPPVEGVTLTLTADNMKLVHVTGADGRYEFGPLDASRRYSVRAEKESYSFGERQDSGDIAAEKLAEILVELVDRADEKPLEGAVVSASGGDFRRNAVADAFGRVRLIALAAAQYYVKPNMKEYRFEPPHAIRDLPAGEHMKLQFRGTRVAWSALGQVVSLGGAGLSGAGLRALPADDACAAQDATTDERGYFRIRGLQPNCVYSLQLKDSTVPELAGLELARAPPPVEVKGADVTDLQLVVYQQQRATDGSVLVFAPTADYRTLKLTLTPEGGAPLLSARLESPGSHNPGVLVQLPRLPADDKPYVLTLEGSGPRGAQREEQVHHFVSDGCYKHFRIHYEPQLKSPGQELRPGSLMLQLLLAALAVCAWQRERLAKLIALGGASLPALAARGVKKPRKK